MEIKGGRKAKHSKNNYTDVQARVEWYVPMF